MRRLVLAASLLVSIVTVGCEKSETDGPAAPAAQPGEQAAPAEASQEPLTRDRNAENLRQIGQAMLMYSASQAATQPATTQVR